MIKKETALKLHHLFRLVGEKGVSAGDMCEYFGSFVYGYSRDKRIDGLIEEWVSSFPAEVLTISEKVIR